MAFSLRSKSPRGSVGLDLDGDFVAAVRADGGRIRQAASAELPSGVIKDGEVVDPAALAEFLKTFFKDNDLPRRVFLGVSNQQIVVRHLELPMIGDKKQLDAAVRFQASEAIAMPLDEVVLDYQVTGEGESADGGARLRAILVAARESMVERFVDGVRAAGLKAEGIDLNAFALVRTLAPAAETDDAARVYCHLGGVTNLAIAVGSSCLFTRTLSTAWDDEEDHAASALAEEIRLSIDFYMAQPGATPAGQIVVSGPGGAKAGLVEELGRLIHLPLIVADPLGTLALDSLPSGEDPSRHTVAAGLALGAAA